ncbi:hypothetical protein PybrP1_005979 [[Pythium] brassicae (nom. inval.)]|nr:hypothetical protein PybrP1_005979 [[Pythium] brassicae (nom. inval.)]
MLCAETARVQPQAAESRQRGSTSPLERSQSLRTASAQEASVGPRDLEGVRRSEIDIRGDNRGGNHKPRIARIEKTVAQVQAFVRERRSTRTRTTAKDVLGHLVESGQIELPISNPKRAEYKAALRAVQHFVVSAGYKRGRDPSVGGGELPPFSARRGGL